MPGNSHRHFQTQSGDGVPDSLDVFAQRKRRVRGSHRVTEAQEVWNDHTVRARKRRHDVFVCLGRRGDPVQQNGCRAESFILGDMKWWFPAERPPRPARHSPSMPGLHRPWRCPGIECAHETTVGSSCREHLDSRSWSMCWYDRPRNGTRRLRHGRGPAVH
jgi:hypothetical protein